MQQIGIGISVHNRNETAEKTIAEIRKYAPKGSKIIVVDDASTIPYKGADFRFEVNAGIAKVKNKCFELLDDCEHIFLFDDDCYPKVKGWHLPYINSGYNHLMYIFDKFANGRPNGNRKIQELEDINLFENPCGCMIYYKKICLETVGGMDTGYGLWGFDHPDHSVRIHNAGLTPHKFMDVKNSDDLFFSYDKEQTIQRSVSGTVRASHIKKNEPKYKALGKSAHYIPYKKGIDLILTCYFTSIIDPQRGEKWEYNPNALDALVNSLSKDTHFHCLQDHGNDFRGATIPKNDNPYLAKWIAFYDYLLDHKEIDNVFLLDGTDVEVLNDPFPYVIPGKIYCGDEPGTINNIWLKRHHNVPLLNQLLRQGNLPLLNAGILGGDRNTVLEFLKLMVECIENNPSGATDMLFFNYILRKYFFGRIINGRKVNTIFKSYDQLNKEGSWFRHK